MRRRSDGELVAHHDRGDAPGAPLLADVLALAAPTEVGLNLDLKASGIERPLVALVRAAGLTGRVTCTGGNWAMLAGDPPRRARHPRGPDDAAPQAAVRARCSCSACGTPGARRSCWPEYDAQLVSCSRRLVEPAARAPRAPSGRRDLGLDGRRGRRRSSGCCAWRSTASARTTPPATAGPERTPAPVRESARGPAGTTELVLAQTVQVSVQRGARDEGPVDHVRCRPGVCTRRPFAPDQPGQRRRASSPVVPVSAGRAGRHRQRRAAPVAPAGPVGPAGPAGTVEPPGPPVFPGCPGYLCCPAHR